MTNDVLGFAAVALLSVVAAIAARALHWIRSTALASLADDAVAWASSGPNEKRTQEQIEAAAAARLQHEHRVTGNRGAIDRAVRGAYRRQSTARAVAATLHRQADRGR